MKTGNGRNSIVIKKIKVSELVLGMYVHELSVDWSEHPFLTRRFLVQSQSEIETIVRLNLEEVVIDTERGLDVQRDIQTEQLGPEAAEAPPAPEKGGRYVRFKFTPSDRAPLHTEIGRARKIYGEAIASVQTMLVDARLGRDLEMAKIQPAVAAIIASVSRNPDAMISLIKVKQANKYTFQHSIAVSALLINFARGLKLDKEVVEQIGLGGLMHDIGKIKIPEYILNKPGRLTASELAIMETHVQHGCEMLENTPGISGIVMDIVAQHHERFDGSGYPHRLKAAALSPYGQMAAIVDVYDAMTSDRIYHLSKEPTEALQALMERGGRYFDPELVQRFIRGIGIYPVGSLVKLESGLLAVVVEQHHEDLLHPKIRVIFSTKTEKFIPPKEVDLSMPNAGDRIVGFEPTKLWKIDPRRFL